MNASESDESGELPGGYDSIEGIKTRARALGAAHVPRMIERAESRVYEVEDGHRIENPDEDEDRAEFLFHLGILTGAALEREYPAPEDESEGEP